MATEKLWQCQMRFARYRHEREDDCLLCSFVESLACLGHDFLEDFHQWDSRPTQLSLKSHMTGIT